MYNELMTNHSKSHKLVVIGPNLMTSDGITFHVHAEGCADLKKKAAYRPHMRWTRAAEFASQRDLVEEWMSDIINEDEESYGGDGWMNLLSEFKFFPCCRALPQED